MTKKTLRLEWAKALHTFQGKKSGPTPEGQSKNNVQRIVHHFQSLEMLDPKIS
jgi:hypothetical protein